MNKTPSESDADTPQGAENRDIESASHPLNAADVGHVHIGIFDVDGAFRHKRVAADKARKLARNGYSFCEVLYQWDTAEEPYITGPFLDRPAEIDPGSFRPYPFADDDLFCVADFALPFGERSARNQLRAQIDKAAELGFSVHSAFEFEALPTAAGEAAPEQTHRSRKARYLWAILLARIYEAFPLTCPQCAGEMRIIAFVTDPASIQAILAHIGEPTRPPPLAPARDPPAWGSDGDAREVMDPQAEPVGIDPLAQPEPEYIFDQRIAW